MGWVFPTKTPLVGETQLRIARLESLAGARDAYFDGCDKDAAKIVLQLVEHLGGAKIWSSNHAIQEPKFGNNQADLARSLAPEHETSNKIITEQIESGMVPKRNEKLSLATGSICANSGSIFRPT